MSMNGRDAIEWDNMTATKKWIYRIIRCLGSGFSSHFGLDNFKPKLEQYSLDLLEGSRREHKLHILISVYIN